MLAATARTGVGLGIVIAACVGASDKPIIHVSVYLAIGFSGMEMETLCRYGMPAKIVVFNNGGIGPGMEEIPNNPMLNMRPNTLIWGARYDLMMEAFGGEGLLCRGSEGSAWRARRGDELQRAGVGQRQAQPGLAAEGTGVPLAQLGFAKRHGEPRRRSALLRLLLSAISPLI